VTRSINGLTLTPVKAMSTVLGTTKGGWVYASQRPAYEADVPSFFVMPFPLSAADCARAMDTHGPEESGPYDQLTSNDVIELAHHLMACQDFAELTKTLGGSWELRSPTRAEWDVARQQGVLQLPAGLTERLADAPASNHRGAMLDGRPRPNEVMGPAASQVAAVAVHPKREDVTAMTSVPCDRPLPKVVSRIALVPVRHGPAPRVPDNTDVWATVRSELLWTTLLGIIPSFAIPVLRGMSDYAVDGWANLLFGGVCAGFLSGAIWRPKRPMYRPEATRQSSSSDDQ